MRIDINTDVTHAYGLDDRADLLAQSPASSSESGNDILPTRLPEGVPSVKTQLQGFERARSSNAATDVHTLWKGMEHLGYGTVQNGYFRFNVPFLRFRLQSSDLTDKQKAQVVKQAKEMELKATDPEPVAIQRFMELLAGKITADAALKSFKFIIPQTGMVKFASDFLEADPSNKGYEQNGNAWLIRQDGSKAILTPDGVVAEVAQATVSTSETAVPLSGAGAGSPSQVPEGKDPSVPGAGRTPSHQPAVGAGEPTYPSGETPAPQRADDLKFVATVIAPIRKVADAKSGSEEGTLIQVQLLEGNGSYYLKAGDKLYEMNVHQSRKKITSSTEALQLAQDYLRFGYITTPQAVVELSGPRGVADGNKLTISAVDKTSNKVNTAQLERRGTGVYRINGYDFRADDDAKAVEYAIARLEANPVLRSPFQSQGEVA